MDPKEKVTRDMESSIAEKKASNGEVVITVSSEETIKANADTETIRAPSSKDLEALAPNSTMSDSSRKESVTNSIHVSFPSSESARFDKPPQILTPETLTRRRTFNRSIYSKPKSRFGEQLYHIDSAILEEESLILQEQFGGGSSRRNFLSKGSVSIKSGCSISTNSRINSINQKTLSMGSGRGDEVEEDGENDEEIYREIELHKGKDKKVRAELVVQWIAFVCILGFLMASLNIDKLKKAHIWGLEIWKWCVLVLVTFSGMLVTNWFMHIVVFFIERNFLLRKKVLYFVHGLKKNVQIFIWVCLILLTWVLLFDQGVERSKTANKILTYVTWTLVSLSISAFLWLIKTLLLKILASKFHVHTFFDRIQESVFHQYVLQTLSGPPFIKEAEMVGRAASFGQVSFTSTNKAKGVKGKKVIDMGKVHQMKREKVSSWTMKVLIDAVSSSGLSTISQTIDESVRRGGGHADKEITNEIEAITAAYDIFRNVAQSGSKYIEEADLLRFMIKEEVDLVFPLFEGSQMGQIDRKSFTDWVVEIYKSRKALGHALCDTKTAVKQLNSLISAILVVVTIIVWLLLTEIATSKLLAVIMAQLALAAFMIGNACKTVFEGILFVFVMHPFDVGDRCVIDGVALLVEEMNLLNTVFLKLDNEKIYYPNAVLGTKPISNYYRSPDMGDTVDFSIDFATPVEKIGLLKERIGKYLEQNPQYWHPHHSIVVKEIENVNKIKMALYPNHTMNFQNFGEKNNRRTELVIELKRIFEELNIKYYLLPQQVHLNNIGSSESRATTNK